MGLLNGAALLTLMTSSPVISQPSRTQSQSKKKKKNTMHRAIIWLVVFTRNHSGGQINQRSKDERTGSRDGVLGREAAI